MPYRTFAQLVEEAKRDQINRTREPTMMLDHTTLNPKKEPLYRTFFPWLLKKYRQYRERQVELRTEKDTIKVQRDTAGSLVENYLKAKLSDEREHHIGTRADLTLGLEKLEYRIKLVSIAKQGLDAHAASLEQMKQSVAELTAYKERLATFFRVLEGRLNKLKLLFGTINLSADNLVRDQVAREANDFFSLLAQMEESSTPVGFSAKNAGNNASVQQTDLVELSDVITEAIATFPVVE